MGAPLAVATPSLLVDTGRRQLRIFAALLFAANLLLPVGQVIYAEAIGENYAEFFWGEWNAITWFSSVQLLLIAFVAYANHQALRLQTELGLGPPGRRWIWLVFAAGFVFLSIDERFQFHEYLRDDVFRPRELFNISFLRAGDVSMYAYLAIGLVFGYFLLAELRLRRLALLLFGAGVGLAAASVVVDTLAKDITKEWLFSQFWTSAFEEIGEIWAQMLFGFAFLVLLDWRLRLLAGAGSESSGAVVQAARSQVVRLAAAAVAVNALLPLGVYAYALITDQPFWRFFSVEDAPTEWFSSVQCLLIAGVASANYVVHGLLRRTETTSPRAEYAWVWLAFAIGFVVLGIDERFDLHEALRDTVLRPAGLFDLPYIVSGDVGLYLSYAVGLVFAGLLLRELRRWPPALALLCAGFVLGLAVVVIDSLSDATLESWPLSTFWDYSFEEVGELWAQLLCLLSFLTVLHGRLGQLQAQGEPQ